jgi:hypothetical protein
LNSESNREVAGIGSLLETIPIPRLIKPETWELRSNMWKHKKTVSAAFVITMLASPWAVPKGILAQSKASVPKPQNTLALGEDAVKDLLLLMETDKNGKISKQAWMRFMGEEFDRLDKEKKGELNAQELCSDRLIKHVHPQDLGK